MSPSVEADFYLLKIVAATDIDPAFLYPALPGIGGYYIWWYYGKTHWFTLIGRFRFWLNGTISDQQSHFVRKVDSYGPNVALPV